MANKGRTQKVREYTRKPKNAFDTNSIMFYGGIVALAGVAVGGYYWMSSIQAAQQAQQQLNAAQQPGAPTANAQAIAGGVGLPLIVPGTAAITVGAVNPLGAFSTIFPFFGGQQIFTLTRRSCDPILGGVPTQADLASQGIVITSYQINNIGMPYESPVCGVPKMSITVGTTDPSSAIKLQALGFIPGPFGGGLLGTAFVPPWSKPLAPLPPFPGYVAPPIAGVIPPYPARPYPAAFPVPLPVPKAPWWYPYRFPSKKKRHRDGHDGKDGHDRHEPIRIIGFPKHNFIKQVGHVLNFDSH